MMSILQILGALEEQGGQSQGTNEPGGCSQHEIGKNTVSVSPEETCLGEHHVFIVKVVPGIYIYICTYSTITVLYLVGDLEHVFFPYIGNFISPTDFHIFQRGRYTTNQICLWN